MKITFYRLILIAFFSLYSIVLHAKEANTTESSNEVEIRDASNFFDETLNDLQEERELAVEDGKKGVLLMFEMDECPFCARMKKTVLNRADVQDYFREHFRIISVDVEGDLELVDFEGKTTTQKDFSLEDFRVRATPVFQFVDLEGKPIKNGRLTGAAKNHEEFLQLGQYIVAGENEKMPFIRYKRKQKKKQIN